MAESLRERVRSLALTHDGSDVGVVTISLGVTNMPAGVGFGTVGEMLGKADEALYRAETEGRDRVRSSPAGLALAS